MPSITQAIEDAIKQLKSVSDSSRLDAELLLCSVIKKDRAFLRGWPEQELDQQQSASFHKLLEQRLKGNPVAHILGERGFWSLNLKVTTDTLIPRPDTERLVELALERIPEKSQWKILDLGTGTGAIGLSLAKEKPACFITATDQSKTALDIARENENEEIFRLLKNMADQSISTAKKMDVEIMAEEEAKPQEVHPGEEKVKPTEVPSSKKDMGPKYLGCFKDQGEPQGTKGRDLNGLLWTDKNMTIERCIAKCRGFAYAGIQYGLACFCGNQYGKSGPASNCNIDRKSVV